MFASSLLLLLAVQWKPVVDAAPVFTPVPTLVPVSETNNETKQESTASSTPRWQRVEPPTNGSATPNPVRWAQAPTSPDPTPTPIKPQQPPKPQAIARSVGRAFSYGGVLYPEVGLRVPTAFRQDVNYKIQISSIFRGSANGSCPGLAFPDFNTRCTDLMYELEATPLIFGPLSIGINYSQQESIFDNSADGGGSTTKNGIGNAVGFQIKANLTDSTGLAFIGLNLLAEKNGPIGRYEKGTDKVQADQGQAYLILASQSIKLGKWFGSDDMAILTLTGGVGNGRYKSITQFNYGYNYGPFGPIGSAAISLNSYLSLFGEWAGQNVGVGTSLKPFRRIPVTFSILYRDWKGLATGYTQEKHGRPFNINCGTPDQCHGTIDGRVTWSF